jgi:hypothetical protein
MALEEAEDALGRALSELGLGPIEFGSPNLPQEDLGLVLDGRRLPLELKYYALVDVPRAIQLSARLSTQSVPGPSVIRVVVSDRIVDGARKELRDAGVSWFDMRGHLFLTAPGLRVDVETAQRGGSRRSQLPLAGRVGLATAIDILLQGPAGRASVRDTARRIGAAPSTVSVAMKSLREASLMDGQGAADLPALFWVTAPRWKPRWVSVSRYPHPDGPMRNPALNIGFDYPDLPGWALTGDLAAAALSAPLGVASGTPPQLYLPTMRAHRLALSILEETTATATPAARLAVAPIEAACEQRIDAAGWQDEHWLLTRPLFIALDLAQDPGRGAEILRDWTPSVGGARVW